MSTYYCLICPIRIFQFCGISYFTFPFPAHVGHVIKFSTGLSSVSWGRYLVMSLFHDMFLPSGSSSILGYLSYSCTQYHRVLWDLFKATASLAVKSVIDTPADSSSISFPSSQYPETNTHLEENTVSVISASHSSINSALKVISCSFVTFFSMLLLPFHPSKLIMTVF